MPRKPRVVITHNVFDETRRLLEESCDPVLNPTRETLPRGEILRRAADAHGLMAFMPDHVDDAFLAACPKLMVIGCALKGYDNFDVDACTRRGIWLTIVPDLLTVPTAELAIGLAIALARNVGAGDRWVRDGHFRGWQPRLYGTGLDASTVGIVGMGRVGRALAKRLAAFDTRLLYNDAVRSAESEREIPGLSHVPLPALLRASDFVFLAVPLNPATHHLIDREALGLMQRDAFLINPCRGSAVDEQAVAVALETGALAGYAADVFAFEDWDLPDRPRAVPPALLCQGDRTLFTPHLGSAVTDIRKAIERSAAESILAAFRGEAPPGAVNRVIGNDGDRSRIS